MQATPFMTMMEQRYKAMTHGDPRIPTGCGDTYYYNPSFVSWLCGRVVTLEKELRESHQKNKETKT